ncbi:transglycosylase-associated protein, partial [Trichinella spiralis]|uniref:transglycosylase-associated protein n=1 Tax=Trichinella spiralis TaxID=6334 RepID=UPI0001EFEFE6
MGPEALSSDFPLSCVGSRIREEPTAICRDPDEAFHRSISRRVDDRQETGLFQAGAKRDDPFPLRGHETSLLRRERHSQARPLLIRFLQPGRTIPPEFVLTEGVQGAAAAEFISRIVGGGTMPPLRRLS